MNDLAVLRTKLDLALAGLETRQTQASPTHRPEKWNIQQIVEHLLLTYRSSSALFERRLQKGRPTRALPSLYQRLSQFVILNVRHFPHGYQAPEEVFPSMPSILLSGPELCERIGVELDRLGRLCDLAEVRFGHAHAISHMFLGPMTVAQWRRFHLVHGLHHVKQIKSILRDRA